MQIEKAEIDDNFDFQETEAEEPELELEVSQK